MMFSLLESLAIPYPNLRVADAPQHGNDKRTCMVFQVEVGDELSIRHRLSIADNSSSLKNNGIQTDETIELVHRMVEPLGDPSIPAGIIQQ